MDTTTEARDLVERRLRDIDEEKQRLERAVKALTPSNRRSPRRPGKGRARGQRKRQVRRGQRPAEVLDFVEKHPGTTATQVAEAVGISASQVNGLIGKLRKDGKVAKGTPLRVVAKS